MTITAAASKLHWNYFLALERDLETLSRYIEFCEPNFSAYSIELAHLLFAAASEVDVIAKLLSTYIDPAAPRANIGNYKTLLLRAIPDLPHEKAFVPRYGLWFEPWSNWAGRTNPDWWRAYNRVKHERDVHFNEATLKNALNALGALLIMTIYFYSYALPPPGSAPHTLKNTTLYLLPTSSLLRLDASYYYGPRTH
jgi:hypothetical protein